MHDAARAIEASHTRYNSSRNDDVYSFDEILPRFPHFTASRVARIMIVDRERQLGMR